MLFSCHSKIGIVTRTKKEPTLGLIIWKLNFVLSTLKKCDERRGKTGKGNLHSTNSPSGRCMYSDPANCKNLDLHGCIHSCLRKKSSLSTAPFVTDLGNEIAAAVGS